MGPFALNPAQEGCLARKSATSRRRGMELAAPLTETAIAEAAEAQRRDSWGPSSSSSAKK
mgnify:CR=1 FL=1